MTEPNRAAELHELGDLFELMWKDALGLLTILREGVSDLVYSAYLNFLIGALVLLIDGSLVASGQLELNDVPSLLEAAGLLVLAGLVIFVGAKSSRRYSSLRRTYSKMINAAIEYKDVQRKDSIYKESLDSRLRRSEGATTHGRRKKQRGS